MTQTADDVVSALRSGRPVLLPTDTVYGLCANPYRQAFARRVSALKGRDELKPMALLAAELDQVLECIPELRGRSATVARALLPGPYTLVLPNPSRRFSWLAGARPDAIGVRVVDLPAEARKVVERLGVVAATSANRTGEPDPRTLDAVPLEIRAACGAELDVGELPGTPSTVLDLTGPEPRVLREGAVAASDALERAALALA